MRSAVRNYLVKEKQLIRESDVKTCETCTRKHAGKCWAFNDTEYMFKKYGYCFAWSGEKDITDRIRREIACYQAMVG